MIPKVEVTGMPYNYNEDYFRDHLSGWHAGSFPKITLLLETYLAGSTNLHVLDFGCGDGIYGPVLRPYASFLAGIEGALMRQKLLTRDVHMIKSLSAT